MCACVTWPNFVYTQCSTDHSIILDYSLHFVSLGVYIFMQVESFCICKRVDCLEQFETDELLHQDPLNDPHLSSYCLLQKIQGYLHSLAGKVPYDNSTCVATAEQANTLACFEAELYAERELLVQQHLTSGKIQCVSIIIIMHGIYCIIIHL